MSLVRLGILQPIFTSHSRFSSSISGEHQSAHLATKNLSNSNRYPDLPNDSFSYSVRYGNPTISATSCMMLAVFAMRELALQELESNFEGKTWALYGYPDVKVSFTPKLGLISTVRWALWRLAVAIRHMMVLNRFETALFETHYLLTSPGRDRKVLCAVPYWCGDRGEPERGLPIADTCASIRYRRHRYHINQLLGSGRQSRRLVDPSGLQNHWNPADGRLQVHRAGAAELGPQK